MKVDKKQKKEQLQKLHSNEFFNNVLNLARDEDEKRKIRAFAEEIYINIVQGGLTSQKIITEHPEKLVDIAEGRISRDKEPVVIKDT